MDSVAWEVRMKFKVWTCIWVAGSLGVSPSAFGTDTTHESTISSHAAVVTIDSGRRGSTTVEDLSWREDSGLVDGGLGLNAYGLQPNVYAVRRYPDVFYGNTIVVGGDFLNAGGDPDADYLAVYRNGSYEAISDRNPAAPLALGPPNGPVRALAVVDFDGQGPRLYVGGDFTMIGGQSANGIARYKYNGRDFEWDPLPSSGAPDGTVHTMELFDDGSGNALYVGGNFSISGGRNVGRFDGTSWSPVGLLKYAFEPTTVSSTVFDLQEHDGAIYAGGAFDTNAKGNVVKNVAKFDGTNWIALGSGINGTGPKVYKLASYAGDLYAGGDFITSGFQGAHNLARWSGTSWLEVGGGTDDAVYALEVSPFAGELHVGGLFTEVNHSGSAIAASRVATWSGSAWSTLGSGLEANVRALAQTDCGLLAAGNITGIGTDAAAGLVRWDDAEGSWTPLHDSLRDPEAAVTASYYDGTRTIIAGIGFVKYWSDGEWKSASLEGRPMGTARAMTVLGTDLVIAGNLHVGNPPTGRGIFSIPLSNLASGTWTLFQGGIDGSDCKGLACSATVNAVLAVGDDLYIGGQFDTVDGDTESNDGRCFANLARWDGSASSWEPLDNGVDGQVLAIESYNGDIYVGGSFTARSLSGTGMCDERTTTSAPYLAIYDPGLDSWSLPSTPPDNEVSSLLAYGSDLIVGGSFGSPEKGVAAWDGSSWSALGDGLDQLGPLSSPEVNALAVFDGLLCIGGALEDGADDPPRFSNLVFWDGVAAGSPENLSPDAAVKLLAAGDELFIQGDFTRVAHVEDCYPINASSKTAWIRSDSGSSPAPAPVRLANPMSKLNSGLSLDSVSPNPTSSSVRIEFTQPSENSVSLEWFSASGRRVLQKSLGELPAGRHALEIRDLSLTPGAYFVRIVSDQLADSQKLVIVR